MADVLFPVTNPRPQVSWLSRITGQLPTAKDTNMPVQACEENGKPGYKYGESGKCYTYNANDEASRKRAKQKAHLQGAAIEASGYQENIFCATGKGGGVDPTCTKEGPDTGGGSGGAGARRLAAESPPTPSIKQPGHMKYGPNTDLQAIAQMEYADAAEQARQKSIRAFADAKKLDSTLSASEQMKEVNGAAFAHAQAASVHRVVSGLTTDADKVAYHKLQVAKHEKADRELGEKFKELAAKDLAERIAKGEAKPAPAPKPAPAGPPLSSTDFRAGGRAMTEARRAVREANRWQDARDPEGKRYYMTKAITKLESAVAALRAAGDSTNAAKYEAKIAAYKQSLPPTDNAWCPTGPGGGKDNSCSPTGGDYHALVGASSTGPPMGRIRSGTKVDASNRSRKFTTYHSDVLSSTTPRGIQRRLNALLQAGFVKDESSSDADVSVYRHSDSSIAEYHHADKTHTLTVFTKNAWCPTGPGGGKDNSCSSRDGGGGYDPILALDIEKFLDSTKVKSADAVHIARGVDASSAKSIKSTLDTMVSMGDLETRTLKGIKSYMLPGSSASKWTQKIKDATTQLQKTKIVRFESTEKDGGKTRLVLRDGRRGKNASGGFTVDVYYQYPDEDGFTKSEGLFLDGIKTPKEAIQHVIAGGGGLFARPQRIVSNAFPPPTGAAGGTRPKLDLPLLPDNLTVTEGENDPNAIEVSRDDLLKIKEVIDRLLQQSEQPMEGEEVPEGEEPVGDDELVDENTPENPEAIDDEENLGIPKSQNDINKEEDPEAVPTATVAGRVEPDAKKRRKGPPYVT